jgi:carbamoyltransferase
MSYTLGIHLGHHSSCALVCNGQLVAAVQQERFSRRKHDGEEALSNRLPVQHCLRAAGITLGDVDRIVSSFQTVSPGGFGLHKPLIEPGFNLFDPWDSRHLVISHHLAHAYSAFGSSKFDDSAVLVCDLGGSSTLTGQDFCKTFSQWYEDLTKVCYLPEIKTECLSIYDATYSGMVLKDREYCIPHNAPESFIHNVASLYDNVARCVFGNENAHGQLMALAAFSDADCEEVAVLSKSNIVQISLDNTVSFRNDWQHLIEWGGVPERYYFLAHACQLAAEDALIAYARRVRDNSTSRNLAVAGGVFLNILANTRIAQSGLFSEYFVPSAPHDAGISVGCAFYGDRFAVSERPPIMKFQSTLDRLGLNYGSDVIEKELFQNSHLISYSHISAKDVASKLVEGFIIARWSERAEFGPRALGGRSILGSPLLMQIKDRLNQIKGRQKWRPVAPIVISERLKEFFLGPSSSPYMTFAHQIRPKHVENLAALSHPDESTRVQTLSREFDEDLYQLLLEFGTFTGYPILVNTSMNGSGEPIIETPKQALEFFLAHEDVDALLLGPWLVVRRDMWEDEGLKNRRIRLADSCLVSLIFPHGVKKSLVTRGSVSIEVSQVMLEILCSLGKGKIIRDVLETNCEIVNVLEDELYSLMLSGIVYLIDD